MKKSKLPASWPLWLVKCSWRSTALTIKVRARDADHAYELASKQVRKMDGGLWCQDIIVKGVI